MVQADTGTRGTRIAGIRGDGISGSVGNAYENIVGGSSNGGGIQNGGSGGSGVIGIGGSRVKNVVSISQKHFQYLEKLLISLRDVVVAVEIVRANLIVTF